MFVSNVADNQPWHVRSVRTIQQAAPRQPPARPGTACVVRRRGVRRWTCDASRPSRRVCCRRAACAPHRGRRRPGAARAGRHARHARARPRACQHRFTPAHACERAQHAAGEDAKGPPAWRQDDVLNKSRNPLPEPLLLGAGVDVSGEGRRARALDLRSFGSLD